MIRVRGAQSAPDPPSGFAKPTADTVGPRTALTQTLTGEQALTELRGTGTLSAAHITGGLELSGSDGVGWLIEDCRIEGGMYTLLGYESSMSPFTGALAERPVIRHCEIIGNGPTGSRSSACIYGSDMVIEACNAYGADDGVKPTGRLDLLGSWVHDLDRPAESHCDGMQIRSGMDILIRGCRIDAYVGYSSDGSEVPGDFGSAGLETGSLVGEIQARFEDNWWAGGRFTVRGASAATPLVDYVWRRNQFMEFGTIVALGRTDLPPNQFGPTSEDLGDFDSSNVWEATGQPVAG